MYLKQLKSLLIHKWYVYLIGRKLGVPLWRLLIHDWSKFTPTEFFNYARFKHGPNPKKDEWARAWLHHLHHNPHHPEYWTLSWLGDPNYYADIGENLALFIVVLPMPETYVREMIADMHSTSRQIAGSWDISAWLNKNGPNMNLHERTRIRIHKIMSEIGYTLKENDNEWSYVSETKIFRILDGF